MRRVLIVASLVVLPGLATDVTGQETLINFDKDSVGTLPVSWRAEGTNQKGPVATWQAAADPSAPSRPNVLSLTAVNHDSGDTYNICWTDKIRFTDGAIEVRLKANTGIEDQGGGLIWRVKDRDNYMIARYNPLEENYRVYFVRDGSRKQLATARIQPAIPAGRWITLRIEQWGNALTCSLDGKQYLEATDDHIAGEGGVGLWTKADAATSFDDLKVTTAPTHAAGLPTAGPAQSPLDTGAIESITGLKGTLFDKEPGAPVFKITQGRTDVPISVEGRQMEPFMGFTSWAAFRPGERTEAMVMGDLVLFQDEVSPVMDALFTHGCTITALHNHFFFDDPRVFFMHMGGEGSTEELSRGVRAALDAVKTVRADRPDPRTATGFAGGHVPASNSITAAALDAILFPDGQSRGAVQSGMYKATIGRTVSMACGCIVGSQMGINTWVGVCGTDESAAVAGDFIAFEGELQPVLHTLRQAGIHIVTIHNHMEGETPRSIFLHYWGKGRAEELARAVKAALDAQAKAGTR